MWLVFAPGYLQGTESATIQEINPDLSLSLALSLSPALSLSLSLSLSLINQHPKFNSHQARHEKLIDAPYFSAIFYALKLQDALRYYESSMICLIEEVVSKRPCQRDPKFRGKARIGQNLYFLCQSTAKSTITMQESSWPSVFNTYMLVVISVFIYPKWSPRNNTRARAHTHTHAHMHTQRDEPDISPTHYMCCLFCNRHFE